ncbi:hypothetical protein DICPUDRAFT_148543 [Dictyostelium purpureum]|uniref:NlpC/P60 domain-containing protein n=1 Tax=Dictyostelium purpureum TaxID=5786 RepID=F0ZBE3_DICPU|nr:uncharacterized protein DICPUDRAFT_148543 [Dictyostelium purpureum]EGC38759.1 hypothetical protein DICPUDRAFT_148543 [Dictyostelium purpureum]|eukprot:XP_003284750.1 hypothetical protein DICPUDRAFT_148543 [Dictyostelium purpureum]
MKKFLLFVSLILLISSAFAFEEEDFDLYDQIETLEGQFFNLTLPSQAICNAAANKAKRYASCGCPYVWGGTSCGCGGSGGMDCSGIVYTSFREAGWSGITRVTTTQINQGVRCPACSPSNPGACKPGDLLFYCFGGTNCPNHVVMAVGGGKVAECSRPGQPCAIRTPYSQSYYACRSMC